MKQGTLGAYPSRGRFLTEALPWLMLAPSVLITFAVLVYPVWDGIRTSMLNFRYGKLTGFVGLDNYVRLLSDPQFQNSLWVTLKFVTLAVSIETVLGLLLAMFFQHEFPGIRYLRTVLIIPMVITPVVVAILFRLIYASDAGMITAVSLALGGSQAQILSDPVRAFLALVALDVWEWTPLLFLILLAGLQSLPQEPLEAARVDGAGEWLVFWHHTLPMLKPVIAIAVILRVIDAFGTFDQVFVMTRGGPGEATRLLSILGYETSFKYQALGYGSAMFVMVGIICFIFAMSAVRMLKRAQP